MLCCITNCQYPDPGVYSVIQISLAMEISLNSITEQLCEAVHYNWFTGLIRGITLCICKAIIFFKLCVGTFIILCKDTCIIYMVNLKMSLGKNKCSRHKKVKKL